MAPSLSGRGYAKHRGVSEAAVRKAIKSERLTRACGSILPDGSIDPIAADREWQAKTDLTKPLNSVTGNPKHRRDESGESLPIGAAVAGARAPGEKAPPGLYSRLMESKARREDALAQSAQLDLAERVRQLVRTDEVRSAVTASAQRVRDQILALPDQIDQELAGTSDAAEVNRILTDRLRRCLSHLSGAMPVAASSSQH